MIRKRVVIVGDGACGKTCLSVVFCQNEFPEEHIPTIFDSYLKTIEVDDIFVELQIIDTAGEEDYDRLRPLSYAGVDVIILCFSIDNPDSLANIQEKWAPELRYFCKKIPFILVGNKLDLRSDANVLQTLKKTNSHTVKYEEGMKICKKIKAISYLECSAKYTMGVKNLFLQAAHIALTSNTKSNSGICSCFSGNKQ